MLDRQTSQNDSAPFTASALTPDRPRSAAGHGVPAVILLISIGFGAVLILAGGPAPADFAGSPITADDSVLRPGVNITPATTTRVSVASNGAQGNGNSYFTPAISADGRYIAFMSEASNLVPGDTNGARDIFVHDQLTRRTVRASVKADGTQTVGANTHPAISGDGRYVAFEDGELVDYPYGFAAIVVKDMWTGQVRYVSHSDTITPAFGSSYYPSISADGNLVAFESSAPNLVPNDTNACLSDYTGNCSDVFVWNRQNDQVIRVSVSSTGTQANNDSYGPRLSPNGRYVAFWSIATNLVSGHGQGVYLHDLQTGATTFLAGRAASAISYNFSYDGRYVGFSSDQPLVIGKSNMCPPVPPNGPCDDVFVYDQVTTQITRVSVDSNGNQGNGNSADSISLSNDGRYVAFESWASNLVISDTNDYVGCDNPNSASPHNCPDIFVHDRQTGETTRVSVASDGTQGNAYTFSGVISGDGRFVAFESFASTLVANDTNNVSDIFVHDRFGGPLPWKLLFLPLVLRP